MRNTKYIAVSVQLFILSLSICLASQFATAERLQITRTAHAPKLSDFLSGNEHNGATVITAFRQRQPNDGEPATRATTAYLSYDDKNLYAVFLCKEDPAKVRAHLSRREDIFADDMVSISLDTFHDGRRAFVFFVNPLGIQLDGIATEGQEDDYSFDTLWHSEGRITEDGYAVLIAIPFKSLRFAQATPDWGIALGRFIPALNELSTWPYMTDRVEAYIPQFGTLDGLERPAPARNLQFIPYVSYATQHFLNRSDESAAFQTRNEFRGGLDAKVVMHDLLTFDFAIKPDFSHVESDEPQVTVNQRYEVFFPEKRPFFTESANFFQTPENLFFSRRIIDPDFGARMTGKIGPWAVGALVADDRAPGLLLEPTELNAGRHAQVRVARVQRDVGRESTVGFLMTQRTFGAFSNSVYSLDTRLKLNPNWVFTAQAMRSSTQDNENDGDKDHFSGNAWFTELRHSGRHFTWYTNYRDRSPNFHTEAGFIPRVDIRQVKNGTGYRWRPQAGPLVSFGPSAISLINWDRQGRVQDWSFDAPFWFDFKGPISLAVGRAQSYELFHARGFRKHGSYAYASFEKVKWFAINASYKWGKGVNFFPAAGREAFSADATDASFGFTFKPTSRVRLEESYLYSRLGLAQSEAGAHSIFSNHLFHTKLSYQFTRALSVRTTVDYEAVLANRALVDLDRTKRVTTDVLVTYMIHPGTALYVGYADRFENLALDENAPSGLRRIASPRLSTGRQFFVKASYLFRF